MSCYEAVTAAAVEKNSPGNFHKVKSRKLRNILSKQQKRKKATFQHELLHSEISSPFVFQEPETATYGFNKSISLVFQERC